MPKATTTFKYDHHELAALMVRDQGIKKGYWMIQASFSWAVSNVVSPEGSGPGALSVLTGIGIQEAEKPTPFTVDAADVWNENPARRRRRKAPPATKARA